MTEMGAGAYAQTELKRGPQPLDEAVHEISLSLGIFSLSSRFCMPLMPHLRQNPTQLNLVHVWSLYGTASGPPCLHVIDRVRR